MTINLLRLIVLSKNCVKISYRMVQQSTSSWRRRHCAMTVCIKVKKDIYVMHGKRWNVAAATRNGSQL